jgi:alkanesulfonate monooxygenase SsuD/methylene tetrahydromethanopterin reductase-like flavin-dependent oxidoreductase (luciferase family)
LEAELIAKETNIADLNAESTQLKKAQATLTLTIKEERKAAEEKLALLNHARNKLGDAFKALSSDALKSNNESFLAMIHYLGPVSPGQRFQAVPGGGTNVPIWLLGASIFSAQLAAHLGLPFAFAGQFAPEMMIEAAAILSSAFQALSHIEAAVSDGLSRVVWIRSHARNP